MQMEEEYTAYKLINGDRLAYHIGEKVTLFGSLEEDGNVTLDTGRGIIDVYGYQSIGDFPNNSRVAEIKGEVKDEKTITFEEGFPIPATNDPDFEVFTQAVELANEAGLVA